MPRLILLVALLCAAAAAAQPLPPALVLPPIFRSIDLDIDEEARVELADGSSVTVRLLGLDETRDELRQAVRAARVRVSVNGERAALGTGNYHLPVALGGARIDCPITRGYNRNTNQDSWGLKKAARLRLWPASGPLIAAGTFGYPVRQRWFAAMTQMSNEPTYVDGGEDPARKSVYYHSGLDIGGCEGLTEVVAAAEGLVVVAGTEALPGYEGTPAEPRYDVVYAVDARGWYYRYSHLHTILPSIRPGTRVTLGQQLGLLGKEGSSGGWSHLHFEIKSRQPSGEWGTEDGYAFLMEAYQREHAPPVIAVARPHVFTWANETVVLDGSRSVAADGGALRHDWQFGDGSTASGARVARRYARAGEYSEVLKVTDRAGHVDYDFAVVLVVDRARPAAIPPAIHPTYHPTLDLRPGQEITFKVRSFETTHGSETWDFGDGTPPVTTRSDGNVEALAKDGYASTRHAFAAAGDYIVAVERTNEAGARGVARLFLRIDAPAS